MVGQGSKNKTVFKLTIEIALVGSVRNVLPSSFYCSMLIRCIIVFIASAKILEREGSWYLAIQILLAISQLSITSVSPIYLVDEFHFLFLLFIPLTTTQQRGGGII